MNLSSILWDYKCNNIFTDVRFICKDLSNVEAHQAVLAFQINNWQTILNYIQTKEDDKVIITALDFTAEEIENDLKQVYFHKVDKLSVLNTWFKNDSFESKENNKSVDKKPEKKEAKEKSLTCKVCFKEFKKPKDIYNHSLIHYPERWNFKCDLCNEKFMTGRLLRHHKAKQHAILIKCNICNKGFSTDTNLTAHLSNIHGKNSYPCEFCGKILQSKAYLSAHVKKHLNEGADFKENTCKICGKVIIGRYFYQHMKLHDPGSWKFSCSYCEAKFQNKSKLIEHEACKHKKQAIFKCPICGKLFETSARRANHKKICQTNTSREERPNINPSKNDHSTISNEEAELKNLPLVLPNMVQD